MSNVITIHTENGKSRLIGDWPRILHMALELVEAPLPEMTVEGTRLAIELANGSAEYREIDRDARIVRYRLASSALANGGASPA
jgi:hypothetical protein